MNKLYNCPFCLSKINWTKKGRYLCHNCPYYFQCFYDFRRGMIPLYSFFLQNKDIEVAFFNEQHLHYPNKILLFNYNGEELLRFEITSLMSESYILSIKNKIDNLISFL